MTKQDQRPDPDRLLAELKAASGKSRRGKLTVFLGMCAGVGKTYAMLMSARRMRGTGIDVLAAVVETHGRVETEALLDGLPRLPLKEIAYRGTTLREMDLDGILLKKPGTVIVDELAHTNAPGSRHPKRHQDVLELLDAGIDVLTTLNVQHIESRVDIVQGIAGIAVRETVPDSIVDAADEIHLVDLTPEILRGRLSEGKVYMGERAATAADNFFREENLTALREMALRVTAEHVGRDLRDTMSARNIAGPWRSGERLMVAVGPSPYSNYLVRYTRRMAAALDAPWVAVYVESADALSPSAKERLSKNLTLARQLGAEIVWTAGDDLATALMDEARSLNVTQIIVGKPLGSYWSRRRRNAALRKLMDESGHIDICVVRAGAENPAAVSLPDQKVETPWMTEILKGCGITGAFTILFLILNPWTGYWSISILYLAVVVFLATRFSRGATFAIATMSALCWNFLFIPPRFTFRIERFEDALMFGMFFLVAVVMGHTTAQLKWRESAERRRQERTRALYRLSRSVIGSRNMDEGLALAAEELKRVFHANCSIHVADDGGRLSPEPRASSAWRPGDKEFGVVSWVFVNRNRAGRGTDTLPDAEGLYMPLATGDSIVGVLGVRRAQEERFSLDELDLLDAFADLLAAMIEREALIRRAGLLQIADESERLYKTLFSSVSHELKTPLAVIAATSASMKKAAASPEEAQRAADIEASIIRLRNVVENLLNMSRLEAGHARPENVWCELDEVIDAARSQIAELIEKHVVRVTLDDSAQAAVKLDAAFLQCILCNLMTNAAQHSPAGSTISLSARLVSGRLLLSVADEGMGIAEDILPHVFEKFFRGDRGRTGGTGLGLAIVAGLAHAMNGSVTARNREEGGAEFNLSIPAETASVEE